MLGANTINEINNPARLPEYDYRDTIEAAERVNWRIEDIIGGDKRLDFTKRFMPESLARVEQLTFLNDEEKRVLNQIKGNTYLNIFVIVEEFIVPFVLDHVRPSLNDDDYRVRAFLQFVGEEVKHIQLFKIFAEEFRANFVSECKIIGPAADIGKAILGHEPLSVALAILMIEWMTLGHYIDSVKDDEREVFISTQHQANRWTYIGSGMVNPKFLMCLEQLSPTQKDRIEAIAPTFC